MGHTRLALALLAAATIAATVAYLARGGALPFSRSAGDGAAPQGQSPSSAAGAAPKLAGPRPGDPAAPATGAPALDPAAARAWLAGLEAAIAAGDAAALDRAARELRARLLGADAATLEALAALLLDESVPVRLRQALAVVLGSLPGERVLTLLASALERCTGPPELVRSLLVALGEARTGPGAGVFAATDRPRGVDDGSGLAPYVMGPIEHDGARRAAVEKLEDPDAETRRTAAQVLRDSRGAADVHQAFIARLQDETDDETGGEIASALGATALEAEPDDPARGEALEVLLEVAPRPGRDITRFRIETAIGGADLDGAEEARIAGLAGHADRGVQLFALEVIYRRHAGAGPDPSPGAPGLEAAAASALAPDRDPKVRETAARALGPVADRKVATMALVQALTADPVPKVRAAAARALGEPAALGGPLPEPAVAALEAAAARDVDAEVREAARAALGQR